MPGIGPGAAVQGGLSKEIPRSRKAPPWVMGRAPEGPAVMAAPDGVKGKWKKPSGGP